MKLEKIAIIGAGGWGTALAVLWSNSHRVTLWSHDAGRAEQIQAARENQKYLPGVALPETIRVTSDLAECTSADLIVFVTPSTALREIAQCLRAANPNSVFLSCTKGIEHRTGMRMTEILRQYFPDRQIAVLSGPNLAIEVSRGLPTATVLACLDEQCASALQQHLAAPRFRIYTSDDATSVELGGALKNVYALAAGVGDGLGLGDNSKAALVTRSLAELVRLGLALGGREQTFYGLSGAGDLIATCFSQLSRNRRAGEQIGRSKSREDVIANMETVPEGIPTTRSAFECARRLQIETPIIDQVFSILYQGKKPAQAMEELLRRDQKSEKL